MPHWLLALDKQLTSTRSTSGRERERYNLGQRETHEFIPDLSSTSPWQRIRRRAPRQRRRKRCDSKAVHENCDFRIAPPSSHYPTIFIHFIIPSFHQGRTESNSADDIGQLAQTPNYRRKRQLNRPPKARKKPRPRRPRSRAATPRMRTWTPSSRSTSASRSSSTRSPSP